MGQSTLAEDAVTTALEPVAPAPQPFPARIERIFVQLHRKGSRPPLFFVLPGGQGMFLRHYLPMLGQNQPIVGLHGPSCDRARADSSESIESVAEALVEAVVEAQPTGPYHLAGYCVGGLVAYEIAGRLRAHGRRVGWLCLMDTGAPVTYARCMAPRRRLARVVQRSLTTPRESLSIAALELRAALTQLKLARPPLVKGVDVYYLRRLALGYRCRPHDVPIELFVSRAQKTSIGDSSLGWRQLHRGPVTTHDIDGDHEALIRPPWASAVAREFAYSLRAAQAA